MWKGAWINHGERRHGCCSAGERLQIMSGEYVCKAAAVSISAPLSGAAPLSTLSLCRGYCEAFTEPTSVRCQPTFSVEEEGVVVVGEKEASGRQPGPEWVLLQLKLRTAHCDYWLL